MTDTPSSLAHDFESSEPDASSALLCAKALVATGHRAEARSVLEVALTGDSLVDSPDQALAMLVLALLALGGGRCAEALRLLERAENLLLLSEHEEAIVRWDVLLAQASALADSGRVAESAVCALNAIALFEDSDHTVAWNRPLLLELERLALADDDPRSSVLLPGALGALRLTDHYAAMQWLDLQESIVRELVRRGSTGLAADHAAKTLCALPVDLCGADEWWRTAMQYLGRVGASEVLGAVSELTHAFWVVEREYDRLCDYEAAAPLLPRERVTCR
ncbi:MAG: hypothetical protein JXA36_03445 [Coriobacteriia bacterium]|nr:hypothetical protein [Coriobacteriia bacterium]